jgi:hypothetical protein
MVLMKPEIRNLALLAALMAGAYLFAVATIELIRQQQRADVAVLRADLAAYACSQVIQEAREICEQAARDRS